MTDLLTRLTAATSGDRELDALIEVMARAMAVADGSNPDDPAYVHFPGGETLGICWRDKYGGRARAALTALLTALSSQHPAPDRALEASPTTSAGGTQNG